MSGPPHCDEVADDPAAPEPLRRFLSYARLPAVCKLPGLAGERLADCLKWIPEEDVAYVWTDPEPELYASLIAPATVRIPPPEWIAGAREKVIRLRKGARVRVTMASRLGDVGISPDLKSGQGYLTRIPLSDLENFGAEP